MAERTLIVGDIHGGYTDLTCLWSKLPELDSHDTVVFLGDYVDRGPDSRGVIDFVRDLQANARAKVVPLCGNHEDGWIRVARGGFPEFVMPASNGCWACACSFSGGDAKAEPSEAEWKTMLTAGFFPADVLEWMRGLPTWYEDEHAIYTHAGLPPSDDGGFSHPSAVKSRLKLLWSRSSEFFRSYRGKRVICGHTATRDLPEALSLYTPSDPSDAWMTQNVIAIDTKCSKVGGFLTALELPNLRVYESRAAPDATDH